MADCRLVITSSTSVDVTGSSTKLTKDGPRNICASVSTGGISFASLLPILEKYLLNAEAIDWESFKVELLTTSFVGELKPFGFKEMSSLIPAQAFFYIFAIS